MNKIQTLTDLLNNYVVEIPIVQRDYAQGRKDDHAELVRSNLLVDIKSALLKETTTLDLNFIFGKKIDGKFIPLDGQQRLTTLFLLHLFAFRNDISNTELLRKFTYETRKSSRDFFQAMIDNKVEIFSSLLKPSDEILDSSWFAIEWNNDPTVQSVLVVLDEIVDKFSDVEKLDELLVQKECKPLIFQFLEMEDLGMEDSLYIKLNARGKPLTSFENFKARLFARLKEVDISLCLKFELLFDGKWTDFFWQEFKDEFDDGFLRFFQVLFNNNNIIDSTNNWANRFEFEKLSKEIFEDIYNILYSIDNDKHPKIREFVLAGLAQNSNYYDRLLFHSVSSYIHETNGKINNSIEEWFRIAKNLIINSQIDDPRTNIAAIKGLNELVKKHDSILEYLAHSGRINGFSVEQTKEEIVKAKVLLNDNRYTSIIHNAETNDYFTGTIRPALNFAYIEDSFDPEIFIKYWGKVEMLFDETKPKYENLIRQALLTYSDYTLKVGSYNTLCVNDVREGGSTPSIKRLFADYPNKVQGLIDDLVVTEDLKNQLETIVNNSDVTQDDWRYCFITYPELFKYMSKAQLRIRFIAKRILLVSRISTSGYNMDLYITTLYEKLKTMNIDSVQWTEEQGTYSNISLKITENYQVKFDVDKFVIYDKQSNTHEFSGTTMIDDAARYLKAELI